jgi:hypothetical protein
MTGANPRAKKSFAYWAFSTMLDLRKAIGISILLTAAFSITGLEPRKWFDYSPDGLENFLKVDKAPARAWLALIQAGACLLLALLTPRHKIPEHEDRKDVDQPANAGKSQSRAAVESQESKSPDGKTLEAQKTEKVQTNVARRLSWLWFRSRSRKDDFAKARPSSETAIAACRRIQLLVTAVYLAWSLYYLITGLTLVLPKSELDQAISVTLNTVPSVLLFWLYLELAEVTVDEPNSNGAEMRTGGGQTPAPTKDSTAPPSGDSTTSITTVPSIPIAFYRVISLGVFALITVPVWVASGRDDAIAAVSREEATASFIRNSFDMISSCLNGVSLALVVGRLGSKIFGLGSITLGLLYFYAIIQPTAPTFHNQATAQVLATTVALPLKALLWLVFVWAYTTGTLAEYVSEIRVLVTRGYVREQAESAQEDTD